MIVRLLTEHHLEFLRLTGSCTGSSESTLVKMPHCWKSRVMAHIVLLLFCRCLCIGSNLSSPRSPGWVLFVCFESLHPSQQFFSYVETGLPGLNQY